MNFLGILRMVVKTRGSVKSLLKLLSGEIISRTYVNTFYLIAIVNPDWFGCANLFLQKKLYAKSHVKKNMETKDNIQKQ